MSGEMRPCPFCGGAAVLCFNTDPKTGGRPPMFWIICRDCHACPGDRPTEDEARALWSTRPSPSPSGGKIGDIVERLRRRAGGWASNISYREGAGALINPDGPEAATLIESLQARLAEAERDWQPISSAPKDGRLILLCWPNWEQGVRVSRWLKNAQRWSWDGSHDYRVTVGEPLYWRPLPEPPASRFLSDRGDAGG